MSNTFSGEIKVASKIVDYLSSGLYANPASCIKELINNSYDADANVVRVYVKPDADQIVIEDDGTGFTKKEFVRHFQRVSESHKREDGDVTPGGRKKIGMIGIGFIAANEICDVMEIYSTTEGSKNLLHVEIFFADMRMAPSERRRDDIDVAKGDYKGNVLEEEETKSSHYTHLILKNVRGEARQILAGARFQKSGKDISLYGLTPASVRDSLASGKIRTWKDFDSYSENYLQVGLMTPVRYHDDWIPKDGKQYVKKLEKSLADTGFRVFWDGTELRQPIVLQPKNEKDYFVAPFNLSGKECNAKGYFYVQHGTLEPQELNGVMIRIRNAGLGEYDPGFLGFSSREGALFQKWISAEIWADDRLEEALNIDRRTLREVHPAFRELQAAFHEALSAVVKRARSDLYSKGSEERKVRKAGNESARLTEYIRETEAVSSTATKNLEKIWSDSSRQDVQKDLLKKYSVAEVYRIVIEAAEETLDKATLTKFLKALTKKLRGK